MPTNMYFTYVLKCADGNRYIGSTHNIEKRLSDHMQGRVHSTMNRLPVSLIYYEACLSKKLAERREKYFKTGYGRQFLNQRISEI